MSFALSVMDHGLWPWGNAKPRREYAAFSLFHPIQGWNKATAHGRGRLLPQASPFWPGPAAIGRPG